MAGQRWEPIERISEEISANRDQKSQRVRQIRELQKEVAVLDQNYERLINRKKFAAKEIYGDPDVRSALVDRGLTSAAVSNRTVAQILMKEDSKQSEYVSWDDEIDDRIINYYVSLDKGVSGNATNDNFRHMITHKISKLGEWFADLTDNEYPNDEA